MIKVKVSTPNSLVPYIKMTPDSKGIVGNFQFFIDQDVKEADWWVVVDGLSKKETVICPKENTILITQETEVVKKYDPKYVNQFNWVITSQQTLQHPRQIFTQQGHQSYLFMKRIQPGQSVQSYQNQFKTYDELRAMKDIPKSKIMTAVISHKLHSDGAKNRHHFITKIKEHFGEKFDVYSNQLNVFGPDTKIAGYKWDALAPYKYVISIENSYVPHWWTNHLFDAFLAGAYPIFYGHPSIYDYFPKNSLTLIDINDIPGSIATIEKVISENYYEKNLKEIWTARNLVLDKYNLFAMLADTIQKLPSSDKSKRIAISPEKKPWLKQKIIETLRGKGMLYTIPRKIYRIYRKARYGHR